MREAPDREAQGRDFMLSSEGGCNRLAQFDNENLSFVLSIVTEGSGNEETLVKKIVLGMNSGVVQNDAFEF